MRRLLLARAALPVRHPRPCSERAVRAGCGSGIGRHTGGLVTAPSRRCSSRVASCAHFGTGTGVRSARPRHAFCAVASRRPEARTALSPRQIASDLATGARNAETSSMGTRTTCPARSERSRLEESEHRLAAPPPAETTPATTTPAICGGCDRRRRMAKAVFTCRVPVTTLQLTRASPAAWRIDDAFRAALVTGRVTASRRCRR
jgi:hypothetical protein